MSKQHPESGRGSGEQELPGGQLEHDHSTEETVQRTPKGRRVTKKLGRPSVGKPEQVRLSDEERSTALELGDGVLAKGVRKALSMIAAANNSPDEIPLTDPDRVQVKLHKDLFAIAEKLGEGDAEAGLEIALQAAKFLGFEATRRMTNGPGAPRKKR